MIYVLALTTFCALALGYLAGRYQAILLAKIKDLESEVRKPTVAPTVTKGVYDVPAPLASPDAKRKVGLVETKSPELLEWEQQQALEKKALGR